MPKFPLLHLPGSSCPEKGAQRWLSLFRAAVTKSFGKAELSVKCTRDWIHGELLHGVKMASEVSCFSHPLNLL